MKEVTIDDMTAITICHGSPYKINEKMLADDNKTIEIMNRVKTSI
ncbi:hypothetical protein [Clostridium sp. YIM B02506]|nr:hypothetical protein [Clostridium sp. YIM B02506]